jgi:hypothetical protein
VLLTWLVLFVLRARACARVGSLLSNRFSVPGSDSENGRTRLRNQSHERSDSAFTLVVQSTGGTFDPGAVEAAAERGARALADGKTGPAAGEPPECRGVIRMWPPRSQSSTMGIRGDCTVPDPGL